MKQKTQALLQTLRALQNIDPEFPVQYAICLAEISLDEGVSLTSLSKKTGMALSTTSRIISALSKPRKRGKNYEFVKVSISQEERRRKELYLTAKGHAVIKKIVSG